VTVELQDLESRLNRTRGAAKGRLVFQYLGEVSEPKGR
jgi:hypothetical protein